MPDRHLLDATPGEPPSHERVQQLIEAERGMGSQGILRVWRASDSAAVVLTSDSTGVKISRDNGTTAPTNVVNVGTPAGGNLSGTYPSPSLSTEIIDALVPPGTVLAWAGAGGSYPTGWLPCNGTAASTTTYPKLFAAIQYTYGGSGGTFNLPNLTGRVILGESGAHPRGAVGGAETVAGPTHTHPGAHSHSLNNHTHGQNGHTHAMGNMQTHVHREGDHTHGAGSHTHTSAAHQHDIDHDHPNAVGAAAASASSLNGRFTAGGVNTLPDTHTHPVDIPSLGVTLSSSTTPGSTGTPSAAATGGLTGTFDTGQPTTSVPNTGTPSNTSTEGQTDPTALDSTVHAANYAGVTVATLPPFQVLNFIIRAG